MMDLTPLDVRKKKGDFRRGLRGYEAAQVDDFLDLVADRMEAIVRAAAPLKDRIGQLEQQVKDYRDRERALTEALVAAQQMREDIKTQSTREVEMLLRQAEQEADQIRAEANRDREREEQGLQALRARQVQFLQSYRSYLEQELSEIAALNRAIGMHAAAPGGSGGGAPSWRDAPGSAPTVGSADEPGPPVQPTSPLQSDAQSRAVPVEGVRERSEAQSGAFPVEAVSAAGPVAVPTPTSQTLPSPSGIRAGPASAVAERHAGPLAVAGQEADEIEEQLDRVLARWEPDLDEEPVAEAAMESGPEAVARDTEPSPGQEGADDLELLLSDDDMVDTDAEEPQAAVVEMTEEEANVDLGFLDFDDEPSTSDSEPEPPPAVVVRPPVDPAVVDREVTAAMGDTETDFIEIGGVFGDARTDAAAAAESEEDITAGFGSEIGFGREFEEGFGAEPSVDGLLEAEAEPDGSSPEGEAQHADQPVSDSIDDADFVESVIFDAETAFNEEPTDLTPDVRQALGQTDQPADQDAAAIGFDDDFADDERSHGADGSDLIDLEAYDSLTQPQAAVVEEDVASLTLHPMFFEEEPSDMTGHGADQEDGHEHEEVHHDQWSSSGGG